MLHNVPREVIEQMAVNSQDAIKTLINSAELIRMAKKSNIPVNFFESFFKAAKKHIQL